MAETIKTGLKLFIITLVFSTLLSVVNYVTAPIISENERIAREEALLEVFQGIENLEFSDEIPTENKMGVTSYFEAISENRLVGYAIFCKVNGDQGAMSVLAGIDREGKISGVKLVSHGETPGLGANAEKPEFLSQFSQQSGLFSVIKSGIAKEGEIVAVTGATNTSRAVSDAVNEIIKFFNANIKGGSAE